MTWSRSRAWISRSHSGELVTILGPSGSGKTTLLKIIAGFELPDEGTVRLKGDDITFARTREARDRHGLPELPRCFRISRWNRTSLSRSRCATCPDG